MAREDAQAVIHLHTPHGQAVSAHGDGLLPLTQTAMLIRDEVAYHDYEGVAVDLDERERIVADLGDKGAMLLRNHGTLAVGRTCADAFMRMYYLERACSMQVRTRILGHDDYPTAPQVIEKNVKLGQASGMTYLADNLLWPAMLRKLDRIDPSFRE
jgi:ribulose-5-phosphate 4-epimerase/fuculose-1-phosphate aldolase